MPGTLALSRPEVQNGITIGTAYGWGAALGGISRLSPKAASVCEFFGAVGGIIGALLAPPGPADAFTGMAAGSGAVLAMGLTAPATAKRIYVGNREETTKSKVEQLMLKEGAAAKNIVHGAEVRAAVGAGLE